VRKVNIDTGLPVAMTAAFRKVASQTGRIRSAQLRDTALDDARSRP